MTPKYVFTSKTQGDLATGDFHPLLPGYQRRWVDLTWTLSGLRIKIPDKYPIAVKVGDEIYRDNKDCIYPWESISDHSPITVHLLDASTVDAGTKDLPRPYVSIEIERIEDEKLWEDFCEHVDNKTDVLRADFEDFTFSVIEDLSRSDTPASVFDRLMQKIAKLEDWHNDSKVPESLFIRVNGIWKELAYKAALSVISSDITDDKIRKKALSFLRKMMIG